MWFEAVCGGAEPSEVLRKPCVSYLQLTIAVCLENDFKGSVPCLFRKIYGKKSPEIEVLDRTRKERERESMLFKECYFAS